MGEINYPPLTDSMESPNYPQSPDSMEGINYASLSHPKSIDHNLARKKILIVEDAFEFRITLKKMLRSLGFSEIHDVGTGEDAVRELSFRKYDIVLCDYNLGEGQNGQQVLEEARFRNYITYSTVFIMVTADNNLETFMGSLEYQADDYLIKPISSDILQRKITKWVQKKEDLNKVDKALENKDFDKVINLCNDLIESNMKSLSEAMKLKGELLVKTEKYAEAVTFYENLLQKGPLPWARLGLGKALYFTGEYDKAQGVFEDIIKKNDKIMGAYDMLASVHEKKGEPEKAQQTLREAVRISPKALTRLKALGNLAYKNKDLEEAEQSFKEVVKQGKHSVMKSVTDYTTLAKVMLDKDDSEEGLAVLKGAEQEFPDPEASVHICAAEVLACKKLNRDQEAEETVQKAKELAAKLDTPLPIETSLDLAKALYMTGHDEDADNAIKHLVQNYQDNVEVMASVQNIYKELNRVEAGLDVISRARSEIVKMNNEGVALVRAGEYRKAIDYFEKAAARLPANKVINANAAHALMLFMQQNGTSSRLLKQTAAYLAEVKKTDPLYARLKELALMFESLHKGRARYAS